MLVAASFVLDMMNKAVPPTSIPWRDTYSMTADAIANAANNTPLFSGKDGPARTAAVMVGVADFESKLNPKARGDGICLERDAREKCIRRGPPQSFCAFQVHRSNFAMLETNEEEILNDIFVCARVALRMMHISFKTCSGIDSSTNLSWRPIDRLNQYATGGSVCVRPQHDEGEHRMLRGMWLYRWKLAKDKSAS